MSRQYYVYIMGNNRPTLYIGVTNNLLARVGEHKRLEVEGFTKRYKLEKLLYFEVYDDALEAILREKRLKRWYRDWKLELIRTRNPEFVDLYDELT